MVSVECVKHRHAKFGGGFVFCHVMLLIILKPSCSNAIPIEYILCNVPDIHIVPFGFSTFLHNLIHFLLNLCFSSTPVPLSESLSHEPLFTETIFPPLHVIPSLLKKYGGSANIISTDSSFILVRISNESPTTSCDSLVSKYNGTFFINKLSIIFLLVFWSKMQISISGHINSI